MVHGKRRWQNEGNAGDQPIAYNLLKMRQQRIQFPSPSGACTRCHYKNGRSSVLGFGSLRTARAPHRFLAATTASTMDTKSSKQQKRQENALSLLDVAIGVLNLAKDVCGIPPAQAVFGSVSILLTMIRVRFPPLSDDIF